MPPQESQISRPRSVLREFLRSEAGGGLVLIGVAILALITANSAFAPLYFEWLETKVGPLSVLHWINDLLMAGFFVLVGLEIKREMLDGQLSTWSRRILPGLCAAGGMVVPALIYSALQVGSPGTLRGWAIPTATDIAFALGILALLGNRIPISLKVFLTALAIIDDLGAVLIIAIFYTSDLALGWVAAAGAAVAALAALNRAGVMRLEPYLLVGAVLWFFVLKSGVHATLAGVALALSIPLTRSPGRPEARDSPLHRLEHGIHFPVALFIVPLFGFANAGVSLSGMSWSSLSEPIPLGIVAGLFIGKMVGVFVPAWAAVRLGIADCPEDASMAQLFGVALLCGIGFTMSLFIGLLAFPGAPQLQDLVKIGVLAGSVLSALAGVTILRFVDAEPQHELRRLKAKAQ